MNRFNRISLITLLALASQVAVAEDRRQQGPYVALSTGASGLGLGSLSTADIGDSDHSGFVGKVSVGYWFSDYWGVSADYLDLGKFEQDYVGGQFRGKAHSFGASMLGRLPLGQRWSLIGKVNLVRSKMEDDGSTGANFDRLIGQETSLVLPSLELNYHIQPKLALTLELDARGSATDKVDLGYVGLGVKYEF